MDELTDAERQIVGDIMESLGWKRLGDTEIDREIERRLGAIILPSYNEGFGEGLKESYCLVLVRLHEARFGDIPDALRAAIETVEDEETLRRWVALFATGSAEDVAAAVLGVSDTVSTAG